MYRLSIIISEIYNKFLPLAEQNNIQLNLDMIDPHIIIDEITGIKEDVEKTISEAIDRSTKSEIIIQVDKHMITITDTGTVLSHTACALLSNKYVHISSRVGFGTKVQISLKRMPNEVVTRKSTDKLL